MAIMTTAEVKTILGIADTTYDTQIEYFLPLVEKDVIEYLNNAFQDGYVYRRSAGTITFNRGDSDTMDSIEDSDGYFLEKGFADGMDISVEGGYANVGIYTIDSVTADKITLDEYGVLIPQEHSDTRNDNVIGTILISRIKWPDSLKIPVAKMIWYLIDNAKTDDVKSESIDDYSITYAGSNAYPVRLLNALDKFRKPVFR
jgi:hypothetical protein